MIWRTGAKFQVLFNLATCSNYPIASYVTIPAVLQRRLSQWSIIDNLWPLTAHIYHVMIIVTGGCSKKSFYYYYYIYFI